ncbi:MAG: amidohydrolase [Thermomicrobiales bacterium]|nr:amidohydrolase [Thermomicrobiales bacterium]
MPVADVSFKDQVEEILPGVIADRRHLHQHPELGFQEHKTAAFITERLTSLGVEDIRTGIAKTGVTGLIRGTGKGPGAGKVVMLRADMDALPILEDNDVEYRSQNDGVMHACGHDSHVSMLLGTTRMLVDNRDRFAGTVKVLFQPAEEGGGGARMMVAEGALQDPEVHATFGIHIWQGIDLGVVTAREGVSMVGADGFQIHINGRGGHGAAPNRCVDPIVVGSAIVNALQTVISREKDPTVPGVVTIGSFRSGEAFNVIPDTADLTGTIRTVSAEQGDAVKARLEALVTGVASAMGATAEVSFSFGAPAVINDPEMTKIVRQAAAEVVGAENSIEGALMPVSEDYSLFLNEVPGCFFFVGSRNEARGLTWGHHHQKFDIDEAAMAIGIETMTRTVFGYFDAQ